MKFKGKPNLFVRINLEAHQRLAGRKGFTFDKDGYFETENRFLIGVLKRQYEVVETPVIKEENNATGEEIKTYQCKKCEFTCTNKGELMRHYKIHKEE